MQQPPVLSSSLVSCLTFRLSKIFWWSEKENSVVSSQNDATLMYVIYALLDQHFLLWKFFPSSVINIRQQQRCLLWCSHLCVPQLKRDILSDIHVPIFFPQTWFYLLMTCSWGSYLYRCGFMLKRHSTVIKSHSFIRSLKKRGFGWTFQATLTFSFSLVLASHRKNDSKVTYFCHLNVKVLTMCSRRTVPSSSLTEMLEIFSSDRNWSWVKICFDFSLINDPSNITFSQSLELFFNDQRRSIFKYFEYQSMQCWLMFWNRYHTQE